MLPLPSDCPELADTDTARYLSLMPTEPHAPVRGRHLEALRAVALYLQGMRQDAYPTAMPVLLELGYVEERPARDRRGQILWHPTPAGRDVPVALGEKLKWED